jgi:predicted Zn-dependent protease
VPVETIEPPDSHHVNAAIGWLGLGCADDAEAELEQIAPAYRTHSVVLDVRWAICAHRKNWNAALEVARAELATQPDDASGWLHHAYALRRASDGGLSQAWEALLPAAKKFPDESVIPYNLSCYACQLNQLDIARHWLDRAVTAGKKAAIKKMALADEDLKPLWAEIREW